MIRTLTTFMLIFVFQIFEAQEFTLSFTQLGKGNKKNSSIIKSVTKNDKVYSVKIVNDDVQLSIHAINNLKLINQRLIIKGRKSSDQTLSNNFKFNNLVRLNKRIYLLVSSYEKSQKKNVLLSQEINEKGDFIGKLKEIESIKTERASNIGGFNAIVSTDTTKLVVISSPPYHKNQKEQFLFKTFDSNLKSLTKVGLELPQKDKNFHPSKCILTHKGNIVFSGYYKLEKREVKKDFEEEKMVVYLIDPSGKFKDFEVSIPKLELTNINIDVEKNDNTLWINGIYRNLAEGKKNELHGIASVKVDITTKEIISKKIAPFNKSILAKAREEKEEKIKTDDGISPQFRVKKYLLNDNGSMWTILERRYAITNKYGTTYFFKNLIVLLLNNEGDIKKSIYIPKKQQMGFASYSIGSFYPCHDGKQLFLILNDHEDNLSLKSKNEKHCKQITNGKKSNLIAIELKTDGSYTKRKLYDNNEKICLVDEYVKINNNNILFEVRECNIMGIPKRDKVGLCHIIID